MAELIKCEVCGHDMASDAKACPNCGHPAKPPVVSRAIAETTRTIENAADNVRKAVKSEKTVQLGKGCGTFLLFIIKFFGVLFVNYFIFSLINSGSGNSVESYIGCSIAATIIFPVTLVWWSLVLIEKHFSIEARKGWGVFIFALMILGSFGPLANLGAVAAVVPYYIVRCIMLAVFFVAEIKSK